MTFPYQKLTVSLISDLQPRAKDILGRRFGLQQQEGETLEAIGQDHEITRERVRQIVEDGIEQVKEASRGLDKLELVFRQFSSALAKAGYVRRQDLLV